MNSYQRHWLQCSGENKRSISTWYNNPFTIALYAFLKFSRNSSKHRRSKDIFFAVSLVPIRKARWCWISSNASSVVGYRHHMEGATDSPYSSVLVFRSRTECSSSVHHPKNIYLHIANMEPIPLRTLTLLLNYERAVSDPRFVGMRLLESTEADPSLPRRLVKSDGIHEHFKGGPDTIEYVESFLIFLSIYEVAIGFPVLTWWVSRELHCNIFERHDEISTSSSPSPICLIHPNASQEVQALTLAKCELSD